MGDGKGVRGACNELTSHFHNLTLQLQNGLPRYPVTRFAFPGARQLYKAWTETELCTVGTTPVV